MATSSYDVLGRIAVLAALVLVVAGCADDASSASGTNTGTPTAESSATESSATESSPTQSPTDSNDLIMDVEFDGRRIHVTCFGPSEPGVPTILFESGGGAPSDTWDQVVDAMAPTRRVCSYDRAGVGASPTAPEPRRTTKHLVADLEATLEGAGIGGPFVLVGWSMAVLPMTVYTEAHREDIAGVVLVDPRGPRVSERFLAALPPPREGEPEAVRIWRDEDLGDFQHDPSLNPEHLDLARSEAEANALLNPSEPFFGDLPLVLLSASNTKAAWSDLPPDIRRRFDRIFLEEQRSLVAESTAGSFEAVSPSGHEIQMEQPQAVIDAIESVLAAVAG
jgi:pimeloyl-ACP methyl ester carboxylesterase